MQGSIELDKSGRFYLRSPSGRMEMPLVADWLRKLAMLARLIATGACSTRAPCSGTSPTPTSTRASKMHRTQICDLAGSGIQVFIATHSLFLLREIEILTAAAKRKPLDVRYFGLHAGADGVEIQQGPNVDDIGDIAALDEELAQSDRFLAANAQMTESIDVDGLTSFSRPTGSAAATTTGPFIATRRSRCAMASKPLTCSRSILSAPPGPSKSRITAATSEPSPPRSQKRWP